MRQPARAVRTAPDRTDMEPLDRPAPMRQPQSVRQAPQIQATTTWHFATLPRSPQYWRWTPTAYFPCLGKPVSSKHSTP